MALAVLVAGALHAVLPTQLRQLPPELLGDSRWWYLVVVAVLLAALIIGDPGRIDRPSRWLRILTIALIALISADNAVQAGRLVASILSTKPFTEDANKLLIAGGSIWLANVIGFSLWYWEVDRGGAVARSSGSTTKPAFVFPEMINPQFVEGGLVSNVRRLLASVVHDGDCLQPDGRVGGKAMGKTDDDAGRGDLLACGHTGGRPRRQHPEIAERPVVGAGGRGQ